ncbi:MAG: histidine kinase N-terminal 7TM domain-containing protein, partial [Anaerolineales bacterium]
MSWQSLYLIIIFAAVAVSLGIAIYAWRHRTQTGVLAFAGIMLAVAEWLFTSGMVSMSRTPTQARTWVDPRFFGLTAMLAFFIVFAIQYAGCGRWLKRPVLILIFAIPLLTQLVIETNAFHHWFLVTVDFSPDGILMGLDRVVYGPVFWAHSVYSYGLVLFGFGLIVQRAVRTFHLYREQAVFMILGILPPLATSITDAFLLIPGLKHPLAPLGFAFMGMCFAWAIFRHRMLRIVPVARDAVIESMSDGMIVLDAFNHVVDINLSAQQLLGLDSVEVIGRAAEEVFETWSELATQYRERPFTQTEVALRIGGQEHYFDLRISPLNGDLGGTNGRVIILRDITLRKQAE